MKSKDKFKYNICKWCSAICIITTSFVVGKLFCYLSDEWASILNFAGFFIGGFFGSLWITKFVFPDVIKETLEPLGNKPVVTHASTSLEKAKANSLEVFNTEEALRKKYPSWTIFTEFIYLRLGVQPSITHLQVYKYMVEGSTNNSFTDAEIEQQFTDEERSLLKKMLLTVH